MSSTHRDFASALATDDNLSATNSSDIITINLGYWVTKFYVLKTCFSDRLSYRVIAFISAFFLSPQTHYIESIVLLSYLQCPCIQCAFVGLLHKFKYMSHYLFKNRRFGNLLCFHHHSRCGKEQQHNYYEFQGGQIMPFERSFLTKLCHGWRPANGWVCHSRKIRVVIWKHTIRESNESVTTEGILTF